MASYYFSPIGNSQQLSTTGAPLAAGTITTFQAGTSTPQATYTDNAGGSPATSLTLNVYGLPSSPVWLLGGQAYKFVVKDALGNTIRTIDNVTGINDPSSLAFIQAGTGAVTRSIQDKERDIISVSDFPTATAASTGAVGGAVIVPSGVTPTLPAAYPNVTFDYLGPNVPINVYAESGETTRKASRVFRGYDAGTHAGQERSLFAVEHHPVGSGTNGPTNADYGLTLAVQKKAFDSTAVVGEVDALNIALRQGGLASDGCALLTNVATYGTGFMAAMESVTAAITAPSTTTQQVRTQLCVSDNAGGAYYGLAVIKEVGNAGTALYARQAATARWDNFIQFYEDGNLLLQVDKFGQITLKAQSGLTPSKTIRSSSGSLSVMNDAGATEIFNLSDAGALSVQSFLSATSLKVSSNQVVGGRITGWGAGTNGSRAALNGSTATLAQTSAALAQLIADLFTHGLIGA